MLPLIINTFKRLHKCVSHLLWSYDLVSDAIHANSLREWFVLWKDLKFLSFIQICLCLVLIKNCLFQIYIGQSKCLWTRRQFFKNQQYWNDNKSENQWNILNWTILLRPSVFICDLSLTYILKIINKSLSIKCDYCINIYNGKLYKQITKWKKKKRTEETNRNGKAAKNWKQQNAIWEISIIDN